MIDQQQDEMVLVEKCRHRERRDDRAAAERILVLGKGAGHAVEQAEPGGSKHGGDAGDEQRDDEGLLFRRQQRDQIGGGNRERDHARAIADARARSSPLAQTRSLIFSRISPVGRQAMMAMTTAKANTSL